MIRFPFRRDTLGRCLDCDVARETAERMGRPAPHAQECVYHHGITERQRRLPRERNGGAMRRPLLGTRRVRARGEVTQHTFAGYQRTARWHELEASRFYPSWGRGLATAKAQRLFAW